MLRTNPFSLQITESIIEKVILERRCDVKEINLDIATLTRLICVGNPPADSVQVSKWWACLLTYVLNIQALYPSTQPTLSERRLGTCQDCSQSSGLCSACNSSRNTLRIFDACCKEAAAKVHAKVTDETWQNVSSIWQLVCDELSSQTLLSQDLVAIISSWVVSQEVSALKLVRVYRICGGLAADRHKKSMDLAGAFYMFNTDDEGAERVLYLYKDHAAVSSIAWHKVRVMTKLGSKTPGVSGAQTVELPSPFNDEFTAFEVDDDELRVSLLPAGETSGSILHDFKEEAETSLRWVPESRARRSCVVRWPS